MKKVKKQKLYSLTLTQEQLEAVEKACRVYGRASILQFDIVLEELTNWASSYQTKHLFETLCRDFIKHHFPDYKDNLRDEGELAFEVQRQIHAHFHKQRSGEKRSCCSCWRSESNLSGQPVAKIEELK